MLTLETLPAWVAALYSLLHAYPWARLGLGERRDPVLAAVLTVALSAGSLGLIMLALAIVQTPPWFGLILVLSLAFDAAGWLLLRRTSPRPSPRGPHPPAPSPHMERGRHSPAALAAIAACAAIIGLTLFNAGYWPFYEDDTMTLYGPTALRYVETGRFSGGGLYDAYPPLVPLLMAFPHMAGGAPNEYAARFVVAALALGTLGAAYALGREIAGPRAGLAAAFLTASVPIVSHWAASGYTDLPAGTYATLAALFAWRAYRHARPADALLAGLLAGLAALTKNGALLLAGSLLGWVIYTYWAARGKTACGEPLRARDALLIAGGWLLAAGLWYAHSLAAYGYLVPPTGWIDQADHSLRALFGPALTPSHFMIGGLLGFAGLAAQLWRLWRTRWRFDPAAALLVGFGVPFWLVWWWGFSYDLRFLLLIWPLFAVMGGLLVDRSLIWLEKNKGLKPLVGMRWRSWLLAGALIALSLPALWMSVDNKDDLLRAPLMDDSARHRVQLGARWDVIGWVRDNLPAEAAIVADDYRFVYHLMQDHPGIAHAALHAEADVHAFDAWIVGPETTLPAWAAGLEPAFEAGGYRVYVLD